MYAKQSEAHYYFNNKNSVVLEKKLKDIHSKTMKNQQYSCLLKINSVVHSGGTPLAPQWTKFSLI